MPGMKLTPSGITTLYSREIVNGDSVFDFDVTKAFDPYPGHRPGGHRGLRYPAGRIRYPGGIRRSGQHLSLCLRRGPGSGPGTAGQRLAGDPPPLQAGPGRDAQQEYISPQVAATPQEAFYAEKESLPLKESAGRVCSEFVMCYPPGIPILAPGERITPGILEYIDYAKEKGCSLTGPEDLEINRLNVLKNPR